MKEDEIFKSINKKLRSHLFILITLLLILLASLVVHFTWKRFVPLPFLLLIILIDIYLLFKKFLEIEVLRKGELVSFEIMDSSRHLLSRGVFYIPTVKCKENGYVFELKELRNVVPFLKGSLVQGYYFKGRVLLVDRFI